VIKVRNSLLVRHLAQSILAFQPSPALVDFQTGPPLATGPTRNSNSKRERLTIQIQGRQQCWCGLITARWYRERSSCDLFRAGLDRPSSVVRPKSGASGNTIPMRRSRLLRESNYPDAPGVTAGCNAFFSRPRPQATQPQQLFPWPFSEGLLATTCNSLMKMVAKTQATRKSYL